MNHVCKQDWIDRHHWWQVRADRTAGTQLCRQKVWRGLRNFMNKDRSDHYSIELLSKWGVEKGTWKCLMFPPWRVGMTCVQPDQHWTHFKTKYERLPRDRVEHIWGLPELKLKPLWPVFNQRSFLECAVRFSALVKVSTNGSLPVSPENKLYKFQPKGDDPIPSHGGCCREESVLCQLHIGHTFLTHF